MQARPVIDRPPLLAATVLIAVGAFAFAGAGFWGLQDRLRSAPVTVLTDSARLEHALGAGPWVSRGSAGPVVWALTGGACDECDAFAADLDALEGAGFDVRVLYVAGDNAPAEERDRAVALARARTGAEGALEPGEAEGFLAWGQLTADEIDAVLALNGGQGALPMLIWRRGPEWRVQVGRAPTAVKRLTIELAPSA